MMRIVTILPPVDREATEDVDDDVGDEVVELAIGREVVMAYIVALRHIESEFGIKI
jgi:hypothetical protein